MSGWEVLQIHSNECNAQVKITDFGLAKREATQVTRGVGTPSYMVTT